MGEMASSVTNIVQESPIITAHFLQSTQNGNFEAGTWGQSMDYLLWVQSQIHFLYLSLSYLCEIMLYWTVIMELTIPAFRRNWSPMDRIDFFNNFCPWNDFKGQIKYVSILRCLYIARPNHIDGWCCYGLVTINWNRGLLTGDMAPSRL